jgi:hypothetical protein
MKKIRSVIKHGGVLLSILVMISGYCFGQEPMAGITRLEILTPGMIRSIPITQESPFPQGMSQFVVILIGTGDLTVSISTEEVAEDKLLVLFGFGVSSAGFFPFLKRGYTEVSYNVGIEIGDERHPYGMVIFSCWLKDPEEPSTYNLTISYIGG